MAGRQAEQGKQSRAGSQAGIQGRAGRLEAEVVRQSRPGRRVSMDDRSGMKVIAGRQTV
jgi:hypothetical protein